jgi:hypothetical protein
MAQLWRQCNEALLTTDAHHLPVTGGAFRLYSGASCGSRLHASHWCVEYRHVHGNTQYQLPSFQFARPSLVSSSSTNGRRRLLINTCRGVKFGRLSAQTVDVLIPRDGAVKRYNLIGVTCTLAIFSVYAVSGIPPTSQRQNAAPLLYCFRVERNMTSLWFGGRYSMAFFDRQTNNHLHCSIETTSSLQYVRRL